MESVVRGSISSITVVRRKRTRWEHVVDANAPGGGYVALCGRRRDEDGRRRRILSITAKNHPNRSSSRTDSPSRTIARRRTFSPFSHRGSTKRPRIVPSSSRRKSRLRALGAARIELPATPSRRGVVDLPTDALRVLQIWTASSVDAVADVARDASSGRRPRRLSAAAGADIRDARASLGASSHALRELEDANAGVRTKKIRDRARVAPIAPRVAARSTAGSSISPRDYTFRVKYFIVRTGCPIKPP